MSKITFCSNFSKRKLCPVRPQSHGNRREDEGWARPEDAPVLPDRLEIRRNGDEEVVNVESGEAIQRAEALPEPKVPTKAEIDAHNVNHLPYRSWCPWCVMARRRNSPHLRAQSRLSQRNVPFLVADYCYMRDCQDEELATTLVAKLYPAKAMLAIVVDQKGLSEAVVRRVSRFIKDSGYLKIAYKSDQEASIRAMLDAAVLQSGREGLVQATPEASAVGESQSNGAAESAVCQLEDLVRTYKAALEDRINERIPSTHPLLAWMVEHAANVYNRFVVGDDGQTPYEAQHGQRFRGKLAEFGEQCHYYNPKKLRSKLDLRWRVGTFLGNCPSTNEAYIAVRNGDVIKTRAVVRVMAPYRWDKEQVMNVQGTPLCLRPNQPDEDELLVEEMREPHRGGDAVPVSRDSDHVAPPPSPHGNRQDKEEIKIDEVGVKTLDANIRITAKDLKDFGYTQGCPRCDDLIAKKRWPRNHSTECRLRIYCDFQRTNHPKWQAVKHLFYDEASPKFSAGQVDAEGAAATPKALDGSNILEYPMDEPNSARDQEHQEPVPDGHGDAMDEDLEVNHEDAMDEETINNAYDDVPEDDVAELFMDDDEGMDVQQMASCLCMAGAQKHVADEHAGKMFAFKDPSAATFMEVYGKSIFDQAQIARRSLNVQGLGALDLRTTKPDGSPWNFCLREDRKLARQMIERQNPDWIVGAPPCTPFSIWNHGINFKRMDKSKVEKMLQEGRLHLRFMCSLYKRQIVNGKYFLHEHPATAISWRDDHVQSLERHPLVHTVVGDQ